ncbi:MAG: D-aminoacylase [Balneolaceae bacterium]|nr:D-aminoacylase [Balneolaceae bacterium]MBO6545356.1 D-aminoacylase [Balneolaceae bacterium]MBO6646752.1 D-aminoacylase [Balneolaceae bacterium]
MIRFSNFILASIFILLASCGPATEYDVIIRNGQIYDGSGESSYSGDIAINADTIAAIGRLGRATGKTEIDAKGKAVSPGFINMLSWANVALLYDGRSMGDIMQGVTLEVMGEGSSMGPLNADMKRRMQEGQGDLTYEVAWNTLGEYLQHLEDKGVSTNVASFVGNGTLRSYVMGVEDREATEEEMNQMKELLEREMQEGAVGVSSSLLYAPSGSADTQELIELAKVVAEYDGMYISHIRSEGNNLLEAIDELITISREAGIRAEVYHLKASGIDNWDKLDDAIKLIEDARAEGLPVTTDMYNYPASSTGLHVQLPGWVREGGVRATIRRLSDMSLRQRILEDTEFRTPPDRILLVGFRNPELRGYTGKYLSDVAEERGTPPVQTMIDLIVEDDSRIQVVYFAMSEDNIRKKIQLPYMSFGSDGGSMAPEGVFLNRSTHPRAYGNFARLLGKYVREEGLISLEEAIYKLTTLPASNLKIKERGALKVGYYADVVVFDPETIIDHATFEEPHQLATGVEHVFVNGGHVVNNGEHTGAMPGRFVHGSGYEGVRN